MELELLPTYAIGTICVRIQSSHCSSRDCFRNGHMFKVKEQVGYYLKDTKGECHYIKYVRPATIHEIYDSNTI